MDDYLKGFNDGYNKAMEMQEQNSVGISIDGKIIASQIEPHITLLQEREKATKEAFS